MSNIAQGSKYQPPPPLPPKSQTSPLPPGQHNAPKLIPINHNGYVLRFEFNSPSTARSNTPDTFNAGESIRGLAVALFATTSDVRLYSLQHDTKHIQLLQQWPAHDCAFRQFFEVYLPDLPSTTAFVCMRISTTLQYAKLKKEAVLYSYLHANNIYMTLHHFTDIETAAVGR
ncbi:hypothetical protein ACA910_012405 [Epithemia clementina (nom. ined.)]